jgi:hypothetical protein
MTSPNSDTRATRVCIIESPYAGANPVAYRRNIAYLRAAIQDCLARGEVPYGSHGFFPGALDDTKPEQRKQGIEAGFKMAEALLAAGAFRALYTDRGVSRGMQEGIAHSDRIGMLYIPRSLGSEWAVENDPVYCEHQQPSPDAQVIDPDAPAKEVVCATCGEEFFNVLLPRDALATARTYMTKRA